MVKWMYFDCSDRNKLNIHLHKIHKTIKNTETFYHKITSLYFHKSVVWCVSLNIECQDYLPFPITIIMFVQLFFFFSFFLLLEPIIKNED